MKPKRIERLQPTENQYQPKEIPGMEGNAFDVGGTMVSKEELQGFPEITDPKTLEELRRQSFEMAVENPEAAEQAVSEVLNETPAPSMQDLDAALAEAGRAAAAAEGSQQKEITEFQQMDWGALATTLREQANQVDESEIEAAGGYVEWANQKIDDRYGKIGGLQGLGKEFFRMSGAGLLVNAWEDGNITVDNLKKLHNGELTWKDGKWEIIRRLGPVGTIASRLFEKSPHRRTAVEQALVSGKIAQDVLSVVSMSGLETHGATEVLNGLADQLERLPEEPSVGDVSAALIRGCWPGQEATVENVRQFGSMISNKESIQRMLGEGAAPSLAALESIGKLCEEDPEQVIQVLKAVAPK